MALLLHRTICLLSIGALAACNAPSNELALITRLDPVSSAGSAEPHLASTPGGGVVLSWLEPFENGVALRAAMLDGNRWSAPLAVASGDNWFVNWADFPSVVPITDTLWAAHWLVRTPGGIYSYNIAIAVSNDGGNTWSEPVTPHDDGTATEHGFVSLYRSNDSIGAIWLDGRNMAGDEHGTEHGGGMTLRSALIDHGATIVGTQLVDELVCDCCQTDVATGRNGPIAVYRNRSDGEIRDIHVVRAVNGVWQSNKAVADDGWKISACPVNGPAIAGDGNSIAVAWYSAANNDSQVKVAWSSDDAVSFGETTAIDVASPVGRVDIELLKDGSAVVSWLRSAGGGSAEVCLRKISTNGDLGPVHVVASTGIDRMSGFPQMIRGGDDLIIAWTDTSGDTSQIATARINTALLDQSVAN
jgi:hypothetical protein